MNHLPRHVGDHHGRQRPLGRGARGRGRCEGHRQGAEAVRHTVRAARELGIAVLTLYAFSEQNWQRPAPEVADLMRLLRRFVLEERAELATRGIRLMTIGDAARLPAFVRGPLAALTEATRANRGMTLCLALSYGGRESVVLCRAPAGGRGGRGPAASGDDWRRRRCRGARDRAFPPPDLVIRTSGERRLSNFLLWEAAYAELYFTEVLWPDFGRDELEAALTEYAKRERRFGKVTESVA